MLLTDPAVTTRFGELSHEVVNGAGAVGAVLVVGVGMAAAPARATPTRPSRPGPRYFSLAPLFGGHLYFCARRE